MWRRMLLRRRGAWRLAHSAVRRLNKQDFSEELRTIAVWSPCRAVYESNDHRSRSLTSVDHARVRSRDAGQTYSRLRRNRRRRSMRPHSMHRYWMRSLPPSSGSIFSRFIVWWQSIQFIRSTSALLVVVLRHRSFLRWTRRPTWAHASPAMIATG